MNRIKQLRKRAGLSQAELAARLYVEQTAVSQWETGRTTPAPDTTLALARLFEVSTDYLLGRDELVPYSLPSSSLTINVYGTVPAGTPLEAVESIIGTENIPAEWARGGKAYFGLVVKGDSMYPKYMEGDIIIVRKQETCENGQDCVVYVNGYDATLKQVRFPESGGVQLVPLNPSYQPRTYHDGDEPVIIAGVVVEIRRKP